MPAQRQQRSNRRAARGKNKSKTVPKTVRFDPTARANAAPQAQAKPDKDNTVPDWQRMGKEVLRLKCLDLHLPNGGTKQELACRLFTHFNPAPTTDGEDEDDVEAVLRREPPEIIRAEDDLPITNNDAGQTEPSASNESNSTDSTVAWGDTDGLSSTTNTNTPTASMSAAKVSQLVHNVVADAIRTLSQGLVEELRAVKDRATEETASAAEIRALRSQIENTSNRTTRRDSSAHPQHTQGDPGSNSGNQLFRFRALLTTAPLGLRALCPSHRPSEIRSPFLPFYKRTF